MNSYLVELLSRYSALDYSVIKKSKRPFDVICAICNEEEQYTLFSYFVKRYYPLPEDLRQRVMHLNDKRDQHLLDPHILDRLIETAYSGSEQERRNLLNELNLFEDDNIKLGYSLRVNGLTSAPPSFLYSNVSVSDYSLMALAQRTTLLAQTKEERFYAKELVLRAIQEEQLESQLIFLPLTSCQEDLLLTFPPSSEMNTYRYNFICPISERKIYVDLPDCYRFSPEGCIKISLYLAAEYALSLFLWKWLSLTTCPHYSLIVQVLTLDHCQKLLRLEHFVDILLLPFPFFLKEDIKDLLRCKYLSHLHNEQGTSMNEKICYIAAECLTSPNNFNRELFDSKKKLIVAKII